MVESAVIRDVDEVPLDVMLASHLGEGVAGWSWVASDGEFACGCVQAPRGSEEMIMLIALGEALSGLPSHLPLRIGAPRGLFDGPATRLRCRVEALRDARNQPVTMRREGSELARALAAAVSLYPPGFYDWGVDAQRDLRRLSSPGRVLESSARAS